MSYNCRYLRYITFQKIRNYGCLYLVYRSTEIKGWQDKVYNRYYKLIHNYVLIYESIFDLIFKVGNEVGNQFKRLFFKFK